MLLRQAIKAFDDEEILYIGARSSFVYCGNKRLAARWIEKISELYLETAKEKLEEAKKNSVIFSDAEVKKVKELCNAIRRLKRDNRRMTIAAESTLREYERKNKLWHSRIETLPDYIENFVPFLDREVKETYGKMDGKAIIFEGTEIGNFWFVSEFEAYKKRGRIEIEFDELEDEEYEDDTEQTDN